MPPKSTTDNVRKICGCVKWKTCLHPWYLDFQRDKVRYRDNLDKLIGRHSGDFMTAKDEARRAIDAKLQGRDPKDLVPDDDPTVVQLLADYLRDKPRTDAKQAHWQIGPIVRLKLQSPAGPRPLGEWRLSAITTETLREFQRAPPLVAGNRDLALLRAAFNYAVLKGLVPRSPFRVGDVAVVKLRREEGRSRRLQPGEAERLFAQARTLTPIITALLETGCRIGELLSLQWHQIRFVPRAEIFLPAQKTKAKKDRRVPISSVLRPVLDARRQDPAGDPLPSEAYVFGNEIGERRASIKSAWRFLCQRAQIANLHVHDLRREAGTRWMDAGVPLATIQRWLGHPNIAQTSTYLGASIGGDEQDMHAFEARIGRRSELTQIDIPASEEGRKATQSDARTSQIPKKNRKERSAVPTIHWLGVRGPRVRIPPSRPIFTGPDSRMRSGPRLRATISIERRTT